jgi:microcystin-dependent protein
MYPIGCIYTSTEPTDPSTLIGGTWVRIKDTFLLAAGDEYAAGETGGESRHELTISELPNHAHNATTNTVDAHSHSIGGISGAFSLGLGTDMNVSTNTESSSYKETPTTSAGDHSHTVTVESTGGNNAHNNMPPYLVVYVWQRVS